MTKSTDRQKSARKAARTRARNTASMKHWIEVGRPIRLAAVELANRELESSGGIAVRFNPRDSGLTLAKGDGTGTLVRILGTGLEWRVWPTGYKNPREYYAGFWEVIR